MDRAATAERKGMGAGLSGAWAGAARSISATQRGLKHAFSSRTTRSTFDPRGPMELLRNVDLYDPQPKGRSHLLVGGERILWVGAETPELPRSLGVVERDLEGRRVIPGLVDCHVHLTGGGGEAGMHSRVPPVQLSRITSGGVTTVIGLLGTDDTVRSPAELLATARGLIAQGLSAYCHTGGYH